MLDMLSANFICEQFLIFHSPHFTGKWVELNLIDKLALEQAWIKILLIQIRRICIWEI